MTLEILIPLNVVYIVGLLVLWSCYISYFLWGIRQTGFRLFGFVDSDGNIDYVGLGLITLFVMLLTIVAIGHPGSPIKLLTLGTV